METSLFLFICWFVSLTIVASFFAYADIKLSFYSVVIASFPIVNTLAAIVFIINTLVRNGLPSFRMFCAELRKKGLLGNR